MRTPLPRVGRRGRVAVLTLLALVVLLSVLGWVVDRWTDWQWFEEVRYTRVFGTILRTQVIMFALVGLGMAGIIAGNLYLAYRLRPLLRPDSLEQQSLDRYRLALTPRIGLAIGGVSAIVGIFAGTSGMNHWSEWLLFSHAQKFGITDPQFKVDVGFYVFEYPFYRYLLGMGFTAVVISVLGALFMHYLYGGVRLQGRGDRMTTGARAHLTALVAAFVLLKAVAYFLDQRGLLLGENETASTAGAGYTDINALLPAKEILAWISIVVAIAILVFSNAVARNLVWPGVALGLLGVSAVAVGGVYPYAVQAIKVKPNPRDKESEYIKRAIEATRYAYGIGKEEVNKISYPAATSTPPPELRSDSQTIPNIRLLDPAVVSETFTQLQQVRGFYDFGEKLDMDRYTVDGVTRDYVVGVREIEYGKLKDNQTNWQNKHTVFTHGYGFVAAPANRVACGGQPYFVSGFLGEHKKGEKRANETCSEQTDKIPAQQPRIYYGEKMLEYAIVGKKTGGKDAEFDRPGGDGGTGDQINYTYEGSGGIKIGSLGRRLLWGWRLGSWNFLLSDVFNDNSRLLYERNPLNRLKKVAPFLTVDGDPYPAVVGGKVQWILDAYTTASTYPYAQRVDLQGATRDTLTERGTARQAQQDINYMRNSVKATVDAYDGTVTLYAFDEKDPVLKAWNAAFGGNVIKPRSAVPAELAAHFRYPEDMFKVQRNLLQRYHVSDPGEFFGGSDFWQVPDDPSPARGVSGTKQPPYYMLTKFPQQSAPTFQLTAAVTPVNRPNLAAQLSAYYTPDGKPKLDVLELPRDSVIKGPGQAQQFMENQDKIRQDINILGPRLVKGNLLTLPVGDGLLYVEPFYFKSTGDNPMPLLGKVLLLYGESLAYEDTLPAALDKLLATSAKPGQPPPPGQGQPPPGAQPTPTDPAVTAALTKVKQAWADYNTARKNGDFEAEGRALKALDAAIKELEAAQQRAPAPAPAPTPSPVPSPTPSK